ncbi:hypothetical protein CN675_31235, partial [Bacillus toyonensis]
FEKNIFPFFQYYIDKTTCFYVNIINTLLKLRFFARKSYIPKVKSCQKTLKFQKIRICAWIFLNNHDRL